MIIVMTIYKINMLVNMNYMAVTKFKVIIY